MSDNMLLSGLCGICNVAKPKYRCPGCSAQTCSLPCYKRHQQWAQCSGKRDPTKFVKKSQLSTPAGIDHDFNFLTSIERKLEKADKTADGVLSNGLEDRGPRRQPQDWKLKEAGVRVVHAPKGMSRQRENETHMPRSKGKHIIWTVEWIREDKTRLLTQCTSIVPLIQILPFKPEKKYQGKRKRDQIEPQQESDTQPDAPSLVATQSIVDEAVQDDSPHKGREAQDSKAHTDETSEQHQKPRANRADSLADFVATKTPSHPPDAQTDQLKADAIPARFDFYLLRPQTSTPSQVLIPLIPSATLADSLRGRTVLEFPTIYVFPEGRTPPVDAFMMETEYLEEEEVQRKEVEEFDKEFNLGAIEGKLGSGSNGKGAGGRILDTTDAVDGKEIVDVLKRDLGPPSADILP